MLRLNIFCLIAFIFHFPILLAADISCNPGTYYDVFDNGKCNAVDAATGLPSRMPRPPCIEGCASNYTIDSTLVNIPDFQACTNSCKATGPDRLSPLEAYVCDSGMYMNFEQQKCVPINNSGTPAVAPTVACYSNCIIMASTRAPKAGTGFFVNPITFATCAGTCGIQDTIGWTPSGRWVGSAFACDPKCGEGEFAFCTAANVPGCSYSSAPTPDPASFGSNCSSGKKAFCVSASDFPQLNDNDKINNPNIKSGWFGSAIACNGQCPPGSFAICRSKTGGNCDYTNINSTALSWNSFKNSCSSGRKVICLKTDFLQTAPQPLLKNQGDVYLLMFGRIHKIANSDVQKRIFGANPIIEASDIFNYNLGEPISDTSALIQRKGDLYLYHDKRLHHIKDPAALVYYQFYGTAYPQGAGDEILVDQIFQMVEEQEEIKTNES